VICVTSNILPSRDDNIQIIDCFNLSCMNRPLGIIMGRANMDANVLIDTVLRAATVGCKTRMQGSEWCT